MYHTSLSLRASAHTGVAIRPPDLPNFVALPSNQPIPQETDCHTSDIGHWFAMTLFSIGCQKSVGLHCPIQRSNKPSPQCNIILCHCEPVRRLAWQSVSKWEIHPIAPKCAGIATPPRAGQASPSPTAKSERPPCFPMDNPPGALRRRGGTVYKRTFFFSVFQSLRMTFSGCCSVVLPLLALPRPLPEDLVFWAFHLSSASAISASHWD